MELQARRSKCLRWVSDPGCNRSSVTEENVPVVMILPVSLWLFTAGFVLDAFWSRSLGPIQRCACLCLCSCGCSLKCPAELFKWVIEQDTFILYLTFSFDDPKILFWTYCFLCPSGYFRLACKQVYCFRWMSLWWGYMLFGSHPSLPQFPHAVPALLGDTSK